MTSSLPAIVFTLTLLEIAFLCMKVQASSNGILNINIAGLMSTRGQVCLSLYNRAEYFPMQPEKSVRNQCVKITKLPIQVSFKDLAPGNYAVAVLHDANGNGKFDRNFIGLPTEGFGFSRNPVLIIKAPTFDQSVIKLASPITNISILLRYLPGAKF